MHSLVAERRHSSVTRYAKRSVACRDSPRHQPLRAGGTPLPRHRRLPHPSVCPIGAMHHRHRRKTAEERFHTLARGWLAYPVTPMHARLPPKSGCINVIPRFALSRRRATALFRNPVRKAQRSVPGFSSTTTSACRRYATSPSSAVASPHRPPSPIGLRIHIIRHPGMRQRRITPRNPIRTTRQRRAHGASAGTIYMRFGDALLRRPRKRSRLQLTPDRVGGTRIDAYAPRSAAAERSIAKCRKLGRR